MKALSVRGEIHKRDGKKAIKLNSPQQMELALEQFSEGDKIVLTVTPQKPTRSLSQNNYYWVYIQLIAEETGHDKMELHEYFKRTHLKPKQITVLGKTISIPGSTPDLSKADMTEYIMNIEKETGIQSPNPQEVGYLPT